MKKYHFILLFCLIISDLQAQTLYVDPVTSGAILAHSSMIDGALKKTNNNLTLIERGQLAVTGQLIIVNDVQASIYKGLSEVAGAVHSLSTINEIAEIGLDIVDNVEKSIIIAKDNPVLLLFAEESAREFKARATNLAIEVSSFILSGGKGNLMDSGERAKLLNHIATELRVLRGNAYGMHRAMYWAKLRGIWQSLNPYQEWVNMDVRIAHDVVSQAKYLKR